MCVSFPGDGVLAHRPNPQPGGPVYLSLSGCSPLTCPQGKGGPTSSYATAGIALWIIAPRKPPYPAKDASVKVEILQEEQNQLTWYGHVQRMAEGRLPKIALKWTPKQKKAR